MAFKILVSPRAESDISEALDYYAQHSADTPARFVEAVERAYDILARHPFFRIRYKNIRAIRLDQFPYLLYFTVNEVSREVRVLSCFHGLQHPDKRPGL